MSERSARYETAVATFVGALALVVSFNEARLRIGVEVCYCSTLGDCWLLRSGARQPESRSEVRSCPAPSERTFQQ